MTLSLCLLAVVSSLGVRLTTASWTDTETVGVELHAAELTEIRQLECLDVEDNLLGLLNNELLLRWQRPAGIPDTVRVDNLVTWTGGLIGGAGQTLITDGATQSRYKADLGLLGVSVDLTVTPIIGSWSGPTVGYRAANVTLLAIPIRVECRTLLGIL